eukprot:3756726-Prymnesium_polylepis.1
MSLWKRRALLAEAEYFKLADMSAIIEKSKDRSAEEDIMQLSHIIARRLDLHDNYRYEDEESYFD